MTDLLIRPATLEDVPVLVALDHVAQLEAERQTLIMDAINTMLPWVIESSDIVVGYGILSHGFYGRSFIELIYIDEAYRSRGYGPMLICSLEKQSKYDDLVARKNKHAFPTLRKVS